MLARNFLTNTQNFRTWIDNEAEAISFLYFIMALVIQAWNDYIANDWSSEQLIEDLSFKVKWLKEGLNQKKK